MQVYGFWRDIFLVGMFEFWVGGSLQGERDKWEMVGIYKGEEMGVISSE